MQSFLWWTAPLYVIFVGAGLYETHFTMTLALLVLLAVLAAFGMLDGLIVTNIRGLRAELAASPVAMVGARVRLERLSRTVLIGGAALGAVGLSAVVLLALM